MIQSIPDGQNEVFFLFEKLFHLDIRHHKEEKTIPTSVSCWLKQPVTKKNESNSNHYRTCKFWGCFMNLLDWVISNNGFMRVIFPANLTSKLMLCLCAVNTFAHTNKIISVFPRFPIIVMHFFCICICDRFIRCLEPWFITKFVHAFALIT